MVCSNPDSMAYGTDRTEPLLVIEVSGLEPRVRSHGQGGSTPRRTFPSTGSSISALAGSSSSVNRKTGPTGAARRTRLAPTQRLSRGRISRSRFRSCCHLPKPALRPSQRLTENGARHGAARGRLAHTKKGREPKLPPSWSPSLSTRSRSGRRSAPGREPRTPPPGRGRDRERPGSARCTSACGAGPAG